MDFSRKIEKCARSDRDNFSVYFCRAQQILLVETYPELTGFRIKIFKKQFVCLLFSVCSFIKLVENMIAASKS